MAKYRVKLKSMVPCYYEAEIEVEAASSDEAEHTAWAIYDADEVDWDNDGDKDYDDAKLVKCEVAEVYDEEDVDDGGPEAGYLDDEDVSDLEDPDEEEDRDDEIPVTANYDDEDDGPEAGFLTEDDDE